MTLTTLGLVSATLEAELRTWVRRHGIVLWLDTDGHYVQLAGRLAALRQQDLLPYDVLTFSRSHLELMLALEGLETGVEKTPLVIHLPGFNEELVTTTPLLELYSCGVRYRKALDTLLTEAASGKVLPDQIATFRSSGAYTVEDADAWLVGHLDEGGSGFTSLLRSSSPSGLLDDLLTYGTIAARLLTRR